MNARLYVLSIGTACGICAVPAFAHTRSSLSAQNFLSIPNHLSILNHRSGTAGGTTSTGGATGGTTGTGGSSSTGSPSNNQTTITVGPGGQYQTISAAVAAADQDTNLSDSYVIDVMPGTYTNDFPYVTRPMTIEVAPSYTGQAVVLQATENLPNEKGIILTNASLTVNGLTFTGARVDDSVGGNGAGIRVETSGPTNQIVENSTFANNQEGILEDDNNNETVTITNSKFMNNGNPNSDQEHGIYISHAGSLTVTDSLFCGQINGNDLKSRAAATTIENTTLYTGQGNSEIGCNTGGASYNIDLPNGGNVLLSGNQIIKGDAAPNHYMVSFGTEGIGYNSNSLQVSGNTFTSTATTFSATAIYDPPCVPVTLSNNTFQNVPTVVSPSSCPVSEQ